MSDVVGVVLAGGEAIRLGELTRITNKHLLPLGRVPMVYHPLKRLEEAGVREVCLVTGQSHAGDFIDILGNGRVTDREGNRLIDVNLTYKVQRTAGGIAEALGLAEHFVGDDRVVVVLGDNILGGSIKPYVDSFRRQKSGARLLLKKVKEPSRFGVVEIKNGRITGIVEKPKKPKSNLIQIGVYMYDNRVFDIIPKLKRSSRGELEITDLNMQYVADEEAEFDVVRFWWMDAGTMNSFKEANSLAFKDWNALGFK
ncbi:MAG: sugar phosphate nucleotidyltransferase [Candidatus Micrarchaeota archaeon]|nr:sugar phosphate nucleotidyltransferase [Candidatus Micrarchaeota archaeon]